MSASVKFYKAATADSKLPNQLDSNGLYLTQDGKLIDGSTGNAVGKDETNFTFVNDYLTQTSWGPFSGNSAMISAGDTLQQFLNKFDPDRNPVVQQPMISLSVSPGGSSKEVGTTITPTYTVQFSTGSYSYGPSPTGVTFNDKSKLSVTCNGQTRTSETGSFSSYTLKENSPTTVTVSYTGGYSAGSIPKTLHNKECPEKRIQASTATLTASASLPSVFRYQYFVGVYNVPFSQVTYDSGSIRALSYKSYNTSGYRADIAIPNGTRTIVIFHKRSSLDVKSCVDVGSELKQDFKDLFQLKSETIRVSGAEGYLSTNASDDTYYITVCQFNSATNHESGRTTYELYIV